ncbi:MAG: HEAT repeat domain-containing protein [Armatimonadetes bacterium]|nr:HEAT repeat domain-containing protein [Armatimonadota bacterium]
MGEDYLLRQCSDPNADTRCEALESLAYRDRAAAAGTLQEALHADAESHVRLTALRLLCSLGGALAVQAIREGLDDDCPTVRREAERVLDGLPDDALQQAMRDLPVSLQDQVQSLGNRRTPTTKSERLQAHAPHADRPSNAGRRAIPLPPSATDVRMWSQQCLHGTPAQRVSAATLLASTYVQVLDLPAELITLWEADDPVAVPVVAGVFLNSGYECLQPQPTDTASIRNPAASGSEARCEAIWGQHPCPRDFLAHVGGAEIDRRAALFWLVRRHHPDTREVLLERLERDSSAAVAAAAAEALALLPPEDPMGGLKGRRSLAEFQALATHRGPCLVDRLYAILVEPPDRWHGKPLPAGYHLNTVATTVAQLLAVQGQQGLTALVKVVAQAPCWSHRTAGARALVEAGESATQLLIGLLRRPDQACQVLAAWALARQRHSAAASALTQALNSPNVLVRRIATQRLATRGPLGPVYDCLTDPDYVVRWLATRAATHTGVHVDKLIDALDDGHPEICHAAAPALMVAPEPERRLASWLASDSPSLRARAARLQSLLGPESIEERLSLALNTKSRLVERVVSTYSLGHASAAMGLLALLRLLYDRQPFVRHAAARALSTFGARLAYPYLREVAEGDPVQFVRAAAQHTLRAAPVAPSGAPPAPAPVAEPVGPSSPPPGHRR